MKLQGRVIDTADGSLSAPIPPSHAEIDRLKKLQYDIDAKLPGLYADLNSPNVSQAIRDAAANEIARIGPLSNSYQYQWKALQTQYDIDYAKYQQELKDWTEAKAKLGSADPDVIKAQIAADQSKAQIAASVSSQSTNKWLILGSVALVVVAVSGYIWYKIKYKK